MRPLVPRHFSVQLSVHLKRPRDWANRFCYPNRHLTHMAAPAPAPATPRLSASLIVVNARNELLLVHRNPKAGAFAGMHVRTTVFGVRVASRADILPGLPRRELRPRAGRVASGYSHKGDVRRDGAIVCIASGGACASGPRAGRRARGGSCAKATVWRFPGYS